MKLGGKRGKYQDYDIIWEKSLRLFIEKASRRTATGIELRRSLVRAENKYMKKMIEEMFKALIQEFDFRFIQPNKITIVDIAKEF